MSGACCCTWTDRTTVWLLNRGFIEFFESQVFGFPPSDSARTGELERPRKGWVLIFGDLGPELGLVTLQSYLHTVRAIYIEDSEGWKFNYLSRLICKADVCCPSNSQSVLFVLRHKYLIASYLDWNINLRVLKLAIIIKITYKSWYYYCFIE